MPIQREFLGWDRPTLPLAVERILACSQDSTFCDLSHLLVVFPGRESGRRFLELLTERASGALVPPRIVTPHQLPEQLYLPQRPFAPDLVQGLVWSQALQTVPPSALFEIVRVPPATTDWQSWLRLGQLLQRQHAELAAERLHFADIAAAGQQLDGFDETARWTAMSQVQQQYWKLLDDLQMWDQQTARLVAIERHECHSKQQVITIGTVDLPRTVRAMLDQIADQVTAYIPAPVNWADRFDAYGCLISERWADVQVPLADDQLRFVEDAAGQIDAIFDCLAELDGRYSLEEISIGMPDARLVPEVQRSLGSAGIPTYYPIDVALSSTGPYRLLAALADVLDGREVTAFAALIRHPTLAAWLERRSLPDHWLALWDSWIQEHLPPDVDWRPDPEHDRATGCADRIVRAIDQLTGPLRQGPFRLSQMAPVIMGFLQTLYGEREYQLHDAAQTREYDALSTLQQTAESFADLPASLDLELNASEALRLVLSSADSDLYRTDREADVQLVGWLDLAMDDAPVAIVTTFNEGFVPSAVNHDLFLPNRLRTHLGIEDNAQRYARDLQHLLCLLHSRACCRLIVARRDALNEPITPSRLLFATEAEQIPRRVLRFYDRSQKTRSRRALLQPALAAESRFSIPRPEKLTQPRDRFRVTEFRDYLASPYRYYLRHILKLSTSGDQIEELDGATFGVLVHEVLKQFGNSPFRESTYGPEIADYLSQTLDQVVHASFGAAPLATVQIQFEQARRRLLAFAGWQSQWRLQGWEIHSVECSPPEPVPFSLGDGRTVSLVGRIDRIDYHPREKRWALLDYKTGDAGASPEKTHRDQDDWIDLQLPLYRHLVRHLTDSTDLQLGYLVLPRQANEVDSKFAEWNADDLAEADEVARKIIRRVQEEDFWVELPEPVTTLLEFDPICQAGVFGQEAVV